MKMYSFQGLSISISHPAVGSISPVGTGLVSVTVSMATERTSHEVAADGSIMVSKILGRNGNVAIDIQQSSDLHNWLMKWFNYIETADPSSWAEASIYINSSMLNQWFNCTGVSPQKQADNPFKEKGSDVTWTLMCADIQQGAA